MPYPLCQDQRRPHKDMHRQMHYYHLLFDLFWNVDLVQKQHRTEFLKPVDVCQLTTKLIAGKGYREKVLNTSTYRIQVGELYKLSTHFYTPS